MGSTIDCCGPQAERTCGRPAILHAHRRADGVWGREPGRGLGCDRLTAVRSSSFSRLVGSSLSGGGLLLFVLGSAGCPPAAAGAAYAAPTAAELVAQLGRAGSAAVAARRAKADYMDRGQRIKIDLALLVQRPQKLRMAGENSLTGPLLTVATDGQEFHLLDVREGRFLRGQVNLATCRASWA